MDNRLKEMIDYLSIVENKSSDLIKKAEKTNHVLGKANQRIADLASKLDKSESSRKEAKKNIDNLITKIKNGKF
jgi:septal ring factor EnvC (AmiA/AmiB activator)